MPGATFGTREKTSAKGQKKWYATLCFDGKKTERFAGLEEKDAYALGLRLCSEYNQTRAGVAVTTKVTVDEAREEFVTRDTVQEPTLDTSQRYALERFFSVNPKVKDWPDITVDVLTLWKKQLKKQGYADGSISMFTNMFKIFLNWCVGKGYLPKNPCPERFVAKYTKTGHYYTFEELELLQSPIKSNNPSEVKSDALLICAIKIAKHQGIRLSQIWMIELEHYKPSASRLWTKGIKGAKDKEVLCHAITLQCIKEAARLNGVTSGRVFTNWSRPEGLGLAFRRKRDRLGITEGDFHDLKHTCVSTLEDQGFKPGEIEDITNTTKGALQYYSHVNEQRLKEKFEKVWVWGDSSVSASFKIHTAKIIKLVSYRHRTDEAFKTKFHD
jgi:integrase